MLSPHGSNRSFFQKTFAPALHRYVNRSGDFLSARGRNDRVSGLADALIVKRFLRPWQPELPPISSSGKFTATRLQKTAITFSLAKHLSPERSSSRLRLERSMANVTYGKNITALPVSARAMHREVLLDW
jgi:hypothetical protein